MEDGNGRETGMGGKSKTKGKRSKMEGGID